MAKGGNELGGANVFVVMHFSSLTRSIRTCGILQKSRRGGVGGGVYQGQGEMTSTGHHIRQHLSDLMRCGAEDKVNFRAADNSAGTLSSRVTRLDQKLMNSTSVHCKAGINSLSSPLATFEARPILNMSHIGIPIKG